MVKCDRTYPAPASLETERQKGKNGSYNQLDVIAQLKQVFHGKCYICEMNGLQDIVHVRDSQPASKATAKLIEETFNILSTGVRVNATNQRMMQLRKEMNIFFKCLRNYQKTKRKLQWQMVRVRLSRSTPFAAFKRDYIRMHSSEYQEFMPIIEVSGCP